MKGVFITEEEIDNLTEIIKSIEEPGITVEQKVITMLIFIIGLQYRIINHQPSTISSDMRVIWEGQVYEVGNRRQEEVELYMGGFFVRTVNCSEVNLAPE